MRFFPLVTLLLTLLAGAATAQSLDAVAPTLLPDSSTATAAPLTWIKVRGNRFVNERGDTVMFHGLSIADPDKIEKNGRWNRKHFEMAKAWGTPRPGVRAGRRRI
jgi:hypothetical protein